MVIKMSFKNLINTQTQLGIVSILILFK